MYNKEQVKNRYFRINELKMQLRKTDYQAIKYAEGEMSATEYAPIREQRRAWRTEINALEAEIEVLRNEGGTLPLPHSS